MENPALLTPYGEALDPSCPLPEYPRPSLRRDSYLCLNGIWDYAIGKSGDLSEKPQGKIVVPFPPESALSGVGRTLRRGEYLMLTTTFSLPQGFLRDRLLLHVGASDQITEIFCNGVPVGSHEGGYLPMTFDLTRAYRSGENRLAVRVRDDLDLRFPTGKQRRPRGGIWYTPISGIWQTVWLESVPKERVESLRITASPDAGTVDLHITAATNLLSVSIHLDGEELFEGQSVEDARGGYTMRVTLPREKIRLWSPEEPTLYRVAVRTPTDRVESYFAFRTFRADGRRFLLNGKPYFPNGVLDQGYFSDGIYTPAHYDAYRNDILSMKRLGFNTLRKHIKIEPEIFYYLCDSLGMLVFQDMVNVGRYSFFKDTVLPFAGLRRRRPYVTVNAAQKENFRRTALAAVRLLEPHPSVVLYTIFNEGWGQFDGDGMYDLLRRADPTRVYDATSGWFAERRSDVQSEHIYFKPVRLVRREERPILLSEFGGYSLAVQGHRFGSGKPFGYRLCSDRESLERDLLALYEREVIGNLGQGLAGAIYTQLSDVEDECNGLWTYDRKVLKVSEQKLRPVMQKLYETFDKMQRNI